MAADGNAERRRRPERAEHRVHLLLLRVARLEAAYRALLVGLGDPAVL
jgi:hypothetical protein